MGLPQSENSEELSDSILDLRKAAVGLEKAYTSGLDPEGTNPNVIKERESILNQIKAIQAAIKTFLDLISKQGEEKYKELINSYHEKLEEAYKHLQSLAAIESIEAMIANSPSQILAELKDLFDELKKLQKEYLDICAQLFDKQAEILNQEKFIKVINELIHELKPVPGVSRKDDYGSVSEKKLQNIADAYGLESNKLECLKGVSIEGLREKYTEAKTKFKKMKEDEGKLKYSAEEKMSEIYETKDRVNQLINMSPKDAWEPIENLISRLDYKKNLTQIVQRL